MSEPYGIGRVTRRSVEDEVYARIRAAILTGDIPAGERLVHEDLAGRFGTSRIPVRDALKRLVFDGLVETDTRRAYRVVRFGRDDIEEIYSLREMLEGYAVRCACERLSTAQLDTLEHLQAEIEQAAERGDVETYVERNRIFHTEIYASADKPRLARMIDGLWHGLPSLTPMTGERSLTHVAAQHTELLAALRARDPEAAAAAMARHISEAGDLLCRHFEQIQAGSKAR